VTELVEAIKAERNEATLQAVLAACDDPAAVQAVIATGFLPLLIETFAADSLYRITKGFWNVVELIFDSLLEVASANPYAFLNQLNILKTMFNQLRDDNPIYISSWLGWL